jgi:gliding motility-associated-like protein
MCDGKVELLLSVMDHTPYDCVWNTGDTSSSIFVFREGTYSVSVHLEKGCILDDSIDIYCCKFWIPNTFTPNRDNLNDVYRPVPHETAKIDQYAMFITDRNGNIIFKTNTLSEGWDGTVRGNYADANELYHCTIRYSCKNHPDIFETKTERVKLLR